MNKFIILSIILLMPLVYAHECNEIYDINTKNFTNNISVNQSINNLNNSTTVDSYNITENNNCSVNPLELYNVCSEFIAETEQIQKLPEGYCNLSLDLTTDKTNYKNGEHIKIHNKLSNKTFPFLIEYWIEDENNTIIKEKTPTSNTNQKQFTPKLGDNTTLTIKNNLTKINCKNINNKTYNELKVFVEVEKSKNANLTIEKWYINRSRKVYIGNNFTTLISAYSGNISGLTIKISIENITESYYNLIGEFNYSTFNISIEIPYDCNITNGTYSLTTQANNLISAQDFTIINNCKNKTEESTSITEIDTQEYNSSESIINLGSAPITGKVVYESTSKKAFRIAKYIGAAILIIVLTIILTTNKTVNKEITKATEKWSSQLEQQ